jgi:cellulose biosynthesis protein BcsQ
VLAGRAAVGDAVLRDAVPGVDVLAGARDLAGVEMALVGEISRERFLADALEPLRDTYATIIVDTPPNLGLLTVNALVCADVVLAPVSCEDEASVQGLVELRSTVSRLDRLHDRAPELVTLLTRWVPTRVLSQVIEQALVDLDLAAVVKVPARAAVGQAGAEHVPLTVSAPGGCVALAYEQLVSGWRQRAWPSSRRRSDEPAAPDGPDDRRPARSRGHERVSDRTGRSRVTATAASGLASMATPSRTNKTAARRPPSTPGAGAAAPRPATLPAAAVSAMNAQSGEPWRSWSGQTRVASYRLPDELLPELDATATRLHLAIGVLVTAAIAHLLDHPGEAIQQLVDRADDTRIQGRRWARRLQEPAQRLPTPSRSDPID